MKKPPGGLPFAVAASKKSGPALQKATKNPQAKSLRV